MIDKKALRKERLQKRNTEIRNLFKELSLKYFRSERTIENIIFNRV